MLFSENIFSFRNFEKIHCTTTTVIRVLKVYYINLFHDILLKTFNKSKFFFIMSNYWKIDKLIMNLYQTR